MDARALIVFRRLPRPGQTTINLSDGSAVPAVKDAEHIDVYAGYAETLFPDGSHVSIRG
ncbi:MAG: hypothetical protein WB471_13540 [Nocardioides sp.]